jgi:hypothetical protein
MVSLRTISSAQQVLEFHPHTVLRVSYVSQNKQLF